MSDLSEERQGTNWLTLLAVTGAFTFTFISRYIWSPVMADVSAEFSINATIAGLYMSAFFIGYLITLIPAGIMADKLNPKYILIACITASAVLTAMKSLITGYEAGLVLRVLTGLSSGCVMASCSKIVALNFPPHYRASAMGILLASPPLGITIANFIGTHLNSNFGWRNTFLMTGLAAFLIVLMLIFFVKSDAVPAKPMNKGKVGLFEGLKVFFGNKQQLILGASGFMFMFVCVGFATWTIAYVTNTLNFTAAQGGFLITCYSLGGIAGSCLSGSISRKLKMDHKPFLILTLSLMCVMTLIYSIQTSFYGLIAAGFIYGFVSYLPSTHYTTLAMKKAGDQYSATAASTQNLLFQLSSIIQPPIIGLLIDQTNNYKLIWYIFLSCTALSVVLCLLLSSEYTRPAEQSANVKAS